jgi:hypothetical protein
MNIEIKKEAELIDACDEGKEYAIKHKTKQDVWNNCERGDWMLWYAQGKGCDLKKLTLAKVKCARLAEHLITDERSKKALDVAERFAKGEATREELNAAAAGDAYAVAAAVDIALAADAYDAAAYAAAAVVVVAAAAGDAYAVVVAVAAAAADAADAADAAREDILKRSADLVRECISLDDLEG